MKKLEYHGEFEQVFTRLADGYDRQIAPGQTITVPDDVAIQLLRTEMFSPVTEEKAPNPKRSRDDG